MNNDDQERLKRQREIRLGIIIYSSVKKAKLVKRKPNNRKKRNFVRLYVISTLLYEVEKWVNVCVMYGSMVRS
ncbi:CLUMA_CG016613, isoform A [Clunio marinus]|uniref:CLUMA_CG016613, isoform A n=1 Tax=Clunio marinus TaxID=568069 RepID=A0A1J1IUC1_9DIPT|nr:CLUMA_CG016613, isoform A [Clunio marinus]